MDASAEVAATPSDRAATANTTEENLNMLVYPSGLIARLYPQLSKRKEDINFIGSICEYIATDHQITPLENR